MDDEKLVELVRSWYGDYYAIKDMEERELDGDLLDWRIDEITMNVNHELGTNFDSHEVSCAIYEVVVED